MNHNDVFLWNKKRKLKQCDKNSVQRRTFDWLIQQHGSEFLIMAVVLVSDI